MLDLQPRVDFEEVELPLAREQELDRSRSDVSELFTRSHRGGAHPRAQVGADDG